MIGIVTVPFSTTTTKSFFGLNKIKKYIIKKSKKKKENLNLIDVS